MRLDLNSIDWASLTHAYGTAEDVPDLIRDLRSSDAEVRSQAMYELCGNIFHQGSRYEASAYAVPFLLELLADPTTPDRHEVIGLLASLAVGYGHDYVATGYPIAEIRNVVAQVLVPLAEAEPHILQTRHSLAAYDAVRAGVPVLLDCVSDSDAEVAGEAIQTLAWFPEEMASIRPRLLEIAADDQQPVQIVGAAIVALGLVGGACTEPVVDLLDRQLASTESVLRWSAAVAWAQLAGEGMPDSAIVELREWAAIRQQDTGQSTWGARPSDVALEVLDEVAAPVAEEVRSDLVAAVLAEQPTSNWHNHFSVVLDRAFPEMESAHGCGFEELTAAQRAVVVWLINNPHVFGSSGPNGPLRQYGLPTTHEALRAYAGLDG